MTGLTLLDQRSPRGLPASSAQSPSHSIAGLIASMVLVVCAACSTTPPATSAKKLAAKACSDISAASSASIRSEITGISSAIIPARQSASIDSHWKPLLAAIETDQQMLTIIADAVGSATSPHPKNLTTSQTVAAGLALKKHGITSKKIKAADADVQRLCNEATSTKHR